MAVNPQTLQRSPTQTPPLQNFAPLKPLLELKRGGRKPDSRLSKVIQERWKHFHHLQKGPFREIINVGQLISLFFDGKQFPVRNPVDGSWGILPLTQNTNSSQRALNVMRNIAQNLLTKWENSNPDILIRPARNIDTCASAAKAADAINNYYERQFYNHWFTQQEGLMGMTFGTYIDRYRFDDSKISMSVLHDIFETKQATMGEGVGFCAECGKSGSASEFPPVDEASGMLGGNGPLARPHCPNCGSTAVTVQPPASGDIHTMTGQETKQIGDLTCELLPLPACRWDLAKRPEDSDWFIYRQRIPKGAITRVLGNVLLPQGESGHDHGLEVLRALQTQGQALGGKSAYGNRQTGFEDRSDGDEYIFDEIWLSPDNYADVNLMGDEETVDGPTIPKGKLTDIFPDGLCAVGLNGMAVTLALYPERHKDHIVSGTWFTQAQTGAGRGLADVVEVQKQFNTMNNQAREYMAATYTPAIGYDNQIWTNTKMKYIGSARTNVPFDLTKLPEGRKLHDSIYQFQPAAMPAQFFNYAQNFLTVMFQKSSMVSDYAQGEPGITASNTTATAAEIDQGNADAINQCIFLLKGDCRLRGAEITICLFRKHFPMKRYFDLGGKYGQQQGIELSGADLKADLVFAVVKNSEMPKGPYTRQKNIMSFFGVIGGAEGYSMLQQANAKMVSELEDVFDVDLNTDDYDSVAELCRRRLEQMKQATNVGVQDPQILIQAIQPPISPVELELKDKAKWFAAWLSTDEGIDSPMALRGAVEFLAQNQLQQQTDQDVTIAAHQGTVAAAAQAPAAMGQHAMEMQQQQASQQPESQEPDPTAVLQMQQEQSQQQHEASESAADRAHQLQVIQAEGQRDKGVSTHNTEQDMKAATHDAAQKIKIEKAKPRPKPAVKAGAKKK